MKKLVPLLPVFVLACFCWSARGQPLTPDERQQIDTFIQGLMECRGLPGAMVAATRNGEVAMAQGYGQANVDTGAPVWPNTAFAIASVSKHFTSLLLSKLLAQRTDVTWDTPIRDVIGEELYFTTGFRTNNTNLRDLLSHKTGVPRNDMQWIIQMVDDRLDIIRRMRFLEPIMDIRSGFLYNNLMFLLAGVVAETLEGRSWEDLIRDHFYGPIGMSESTFVDIDGADRQRFATPYQNVSGVLVEQPFELFRSSGLVGPAASVASTANDMALWLNFLLTGQGSGGQVVMNLTDIEATWEKDAFGSLRNDAYNPFLKPGNPVSWAHSSYGKAFSLGYYRGLHTASHGGDLFGYHSVLIVVPDRNVGVHVSINIGHLDERRLMALHVLDVLMGETPWLNVSYACNEFPLPFTPVYNDMTDVNIDLFRPPNADVPPPVLPLARDLTEYVGTYGNFGYGNASVAVGGEIGNLTMNLEARLGTYELISDGNDEFTAIGVGNSSMINLGPVEFSSSQGAGGPIDRLTIFGLEIRQPPVFIRDLKLADAPPPRMDTC